VDFSAHTVEIVTTDTTTLSNNASPGTLPTVNPNLDMNGATSYSLGGNTFSGSVNSINGMSGNVTCRFYGPGIVAATANKVLGAPIEIGCTFSAMNTTVGAMQGSFGGN
jgi:hypothetical protein